MKKIYNIIDSELILRTNNHRLRQEFGEVGTSPSISAEGTSTIFTTKAVIREINFITVNGLVLTEGVHYILGADKGTVKISNSGAPVRKNPSLTTTILVSYYAGPLKANVVRIPPVVNLFTLNKYSGKNTELIFNFSITANGGRNIFWSILRDGSNTPLYSGNSLQTVNGVSTIGNVSTTLNHFITEQDFLKKEGQDIPFTLVVVYDLTDDGSRLDEKILNTAVYKVSSQQSVTGYLTALPEVINSVNTSNTIGVTYNINAGTDFVGLFDWVIYKSIGGAALVPVRQGNQASPILAGTYTENVASKEGDSYDIRYSLGIKESGASIYTIVANDRVVISVPVATLIARAGYLDAAIMSYVDGLDGVRKKLGSLGTARDAVEYTNRVPRAIFTKDVPKSFLTSQAFISASVNTFVGTVSAVYFVIELPDSWGPVSFYQTLGLVNPTAFNKISLGNGYTAYLYQVAPSSVSTPSDYYLKPRA
jgi:hypothetical protein